MSRVLKRKTDNRPTWVRVREFGPASDRRRRRIGWRRVELEGVAWWVGQPYPHTSHNQSNWGITYIYIEREREREGERELRKLLKTRITFQGILFIYNFELLAAIYIFCSITLYFWNVKQCSLFCLEETYLHKGET